jgi:RNA polymerase sigma factor (sigma-70 family)
LGSLPHPPQLALGAGIAPLDERYCVSLSCDIEAKHFENAQAFLAFMIQIAEREVLQEKRKVVRRRKLGPQKSLEELSQKEAGELLDGQAEPVDLEIAREQWQRALKQLLPAYRAIALRLRDGFTHAEIAAEFKVSERTVRRVVQQLRNLLDEGGIG